MVENVEKCGGKTIRYPSECSYMCWCSSRTGCMWSVNCNGSLITGEGFTPPKPPRDPHVTVAGNLATIAQLLQKSWKLPVIVPAKLRRRKIRRRTIKGTPERIADALGLQLGPRRKA
jgi:hypothetical protein